MGLAFGNIVSLYILLPLLGILLGGVLFFVAKKNRLLENRKVIIYFLLSCTALVIPAFLGFIDYWFMPYFYIGLLALYLILGYCHVKILEWLIDGWNEKSYWVEILCVFVVMFVGAALFSLVFNLCNELKYGLWACTCLLSFLLPSLYRKACQSFLDIPLEVYAVWSYEKEGREMRSEYIDRNKTIVVELELFKEVADIEPLNIKAKAWENVPFGIWFKVFTDDYNKKNAVSPIDVNAYEWIFYINTFWGRKKYINPDLDFGKNRIREKNIILAKRVQQNQETIG